jgi:hypothetical protein
MTKLQLVAAVALLGTLSLSSPAFAKDCIKFCQERCGGKGNFCLGNCQQRCEQNNREKGGNRSNLPYSFSYKSVAGL